ncbi:Protein of unknown function, DUF547 [Limimonas halophila]|uniref:DUF547 domain-containing protein n=1 Tax=Limimonas halophila TaxID=1082479 RepID=A0A1G7TF58_9PROT|nr:DUF547 domain-containing protein [Limimonas halophila]SDG33948.1 Protein of unknown function, DUF547 [Limimonas halophila]
MTARFVSRRTFLGTASALAVGATLPVPARAAPEADLWPRWEKHDPESTKTIDHGAWGDFLKKYVSRGPDGVNRVAYGAVDQADRTALKGYLDALTGTRISEYNRAEQFAYWANLYNALTVEVILRHWPVDTIRDIDISPGLFSDGPWGKKLVTVEGAELSLNDIEHRILRPIWQDPRVHYAVNCASIGCPNLRVEPFTGAKLDQQLNEAARTYVNHPRGATVRNGELVVSSIYEWFQEDFGGSDAGVIEHLRQYAEPALKDKLADFSSIGDDRYDWSINAPVSRG